MQIRDRRSVPHTGCGNVEPRHSTLILSIKVDEAASLPMAHGKQSLRDFSAEATYEVLFCMEAEAGIEPAYAALQAAA